MSYFVVVTFDIANGDLRTMKAFYQDFAALDLSRTLQLAKEML